MFSLRGAADPTSDASSVEASGFELKFSKALSPHKISEKLFEASWLDINAARQSKKKGKKGKGGTERKEREEERKVKRKEKKGTTAIWSGIVCNIGWKWYPALESGLFGVILFQKNV